MEHWLITRQRHLISPSHARLPQASTVLITGIPKEYMDEKELEGLFTNLPGGVKRIWLARWVTSHWSSTLNSLSPNQADA